MAQDIQQVGTSPTEAKCILQMEKDLARLQKLLSTGLENNQQLPTEPEPGPSHGSTPTKQTSGPKTLSAKEKTGNTTNTRRTSNLGSCRTLQTAKKRINDEDNGWAKTKDDEKNDSLLMPPPVAKGVLKGTIKGWNENAWNSNNLSKNLRAAVFGFCFHYLLMNVSNLSSIKVVWLPKLF